MEALETMTHKISGDEYIDRAVNFVISNFPIVKTATLEVLETLFAPKAMAKQLALVFVLETGVVRRGKNIFFKSKRWNVNVPHQSLVLLLWTLCNPYR